MDAPQPAQWVRLTSFLGLYGEVEADLLVANLQGHGIAAVRLPMQPLSALLGAPAVILPIEVLVPAEAWDDASALLGEQPRMTVPRPVGAVAQWWATARLLGVAAETCGVMAVGEGLAAWLSTFFAIAFGVAVLFLLRAGVRMIGWLAAEQRPLPDRRVIGTAIAVWTLLIVVVSVLSWIVSFVPTVLAR